MKNQKKKSYDTYILMGILVMFIIGLVLLYSGLKTAFGGFDKTGESKKLKQDILDNLKSIDDRLDEVDRLLGIRHGETP